MNSIYFKQSELLLKIIPLIFKEKDLALKGGTAINNMEPHFFDRSGKKIHSIYQAK